MFAFIVFISEFHRTFHLGIWVEVSVECFRRWPPFECMVKSILNAHKHFVLSARQREQQLADLRCNQSPKFWNCLKYVLMCSNELFSSKNVVPLSFEPFRRMLNRIWKFRKIGENHDFSFGLALPIFLKFWNCRSMNYTLISKKLVIFVNFSKLENSVQNTLKWLKVKWNYIRWCKQMTWNIKYEHHFFGDFQNFGKIGNGGAKKNRAGTTLRLFRFVNTANNLGNNNSSVRREAGFL